MTPARFPSYDAKALAALDAVSAEIAALFAEAGYAPAEPPVIQPADVFLDLYGETIRKRIYLFTDPHGEELCLRPDLTVPLGRMSLARGLVGKGPLMLSYDGPVFRAVPRDEGRPAQFRQAGIEHYGGTDREDTDAQVFALIHGACARLRPGGFGMMLGDLGLFAAFVDALDLPDAWRGRLKRRFRSPAALNDVLERASHGGSGMTALVTALSHLDETDARAALGDVLSLADIDSVSGRKLDEITERLLEQAAAASATGLPAGTTGLLRRFVDLTADAPRAVDTVAALAKDAGIALGAPLDAFARRLDLIRKRKVPLDGARFATGFGRDMSYYTGFVFEFTGSAVGTPVRLAGGGRYDGLLQRLGAAMPCPAVGGAIWIERLLAAPAQNRTPGRAKPEAAP